MHESNHVTQLIIEILEKSRLLNSLYKIDRDYIEKNNITLMEEGNVKKTVIHNLLLSAIDALDNNPNISARTGSLFERIQDYAQSLPSSDKKNFIFLLDTLKTELLVYNQILHVNRTVVHVNLMQTRDLFRAILNVNIDDDQSVYKSTGQLESAR